MFFIGKIHSWNDKIWPRFGNWPSVAMERNAHICTIMGMWYYIVSLYHNNSQFCVCYVSEWAMMMGIARQHCFVIVTPVYQMHIDDHRDMHLQSPNSRQNSRSILPDASAQTQPKWVIVRKIHMQNVLNKALYKFKQQKQTIDIRNGMNRIPTQSYTQRKKKRERAKKRERNGMCWMKACGQKRFEWNTFFPRMYKSTRHLSVCVNVFDTPPEKFVWLWMFQAHTRPSFEL